MPPFSSNCYLFVYFCTYLQFASSQFLHGVLNNVYSHVHENSAPTPDLARLNGYRCDSHTVVTEDGYILQIHRMPGSPVTPLKCSLPPVLLNHVIFGDSSVWLHTGPTQGLAYLLADQGYDVWLMNIRGNVYSRQNLYYSVDQDEFWEFSWEQAGYIDTAAVIDYMLNTTGHKSILYVGHSMSTSELFALLALRPEYNEKIQYAVAFAPLAYLNHSINLITAQAPLKDVVQLALSLPEHGELIIHRNSLLSNVIKVFCSVRVNEEICEAGLFALFGIDIVGSNETLTPIIFGHYPSGGSVDTLVHYFQIFDAMRFQRFDYGPVKNLKTYGSIIPPEFNLSNIAVPMTFFYSLGDIVADVTDVFILAKLLNVDIDLYRVKLATFNHVDYIWGKNLKKLVNDKVIKIFKSKQRVL